MVVSIILHLRLYCIWPAKIWKPILFYLSNDSAIYNHLQELNYDIPEHNTVNIEILQYDYEVKIAHTRQPTFWDKHLDWDQIPMLKVEFKNFSISAYKK